MIGLVLGIVIGAGAALVYRMAYDETPVTGDSPIDKLKLQAREARREAELAAKQKEAELLAEYEATVHRPETQP